MSSDENAAVKVLEQRLDDVVARIDRDAESRTAIYNRLAGVEKANHFIAARRPIFVWGAGVVAIVISGFIGAAIDRLIARAL